MLSVGLFVGPAIMSLLGTTGHLPFLASAGLLLLACLPILLARRMLRPAGEESRIMGLAAAFMRKPSAMITGAFDGFIFQTLLIFLPVYALRLGASGERAIEYLMVYMLGGIPLQLLIGYLLDRMGAEAVLILCCSIIAPALPAFAWLIDQRGAAWLVLVCMGAASAAVYTAGLAAIGNAFSAEEMASGTAAFNISWLIGAIVGPAAAGYAATHWDPHGIICSIVLSCALLGLVNLHARFRRASHPIWR